LDEDKFDTSFIAFRDDEYLNDVVLAQDFVGFSRTNSNWRLNILAYPNLESVVEVGLEVIKNYKVEKPEVAEEHLEDFATQFAFIGLRIG